MANLFSDADVNVDQLDLQLQALSLPGYTGLRRHRGTQIEVMANDLSDSDVARVQAVIDAHEPTVEKTVDVERTEAIDAIDTIADTKEMLHKYLK
jgi:hypothetical protein